jgi:anti-sigma B factor antagonist
MTTDEPPTVATPFELSVGGSATDPVVAVRGELDVATSPQLRSELTGLLADGATSLRLEFAGVSFVDSSGLGVLVGIYKRMREEGRGGSIRIAGAQPSVRKIFEITGLESALLER